MKSLCPKTLLPLVFAAGLCLPAQAVTLDIRNPHGAVHVKVDPSPRLRVEGLGSTRSAGVNDIKTTRMDDRIVVRCDPPDGESIDLEVQVPLGFGLEVVTEDGEISVEGMVPRANLETKGGSIRVKVPWRSTRLRLDSEQKPGDVTTPRGVKFSTGMIRLTDERRVWRLNDTLNARTPVYGDLRIWARNPKQVVLEDFTIPSTWPLKMPWQAPDLLDEILRGPPAGAMVQPLNSPAPPPESGSGELTIPEEGALFRSDVRMVNLTVTVNDKSGRPITNLRPQDFRVVENGREQTVTYAGSDDVPFNLAILLDLSGSTRPDRAAMRAVTERFVSMLRPSDKVAIYALAGAMFHVVSRLTEDREKLLETINRLPAVSGASPLYDAMVLAYAEELQQRPGERNALIVISDGIDNQLSRHEAPSKVSFRKLLKAAGEVHALIYPIFLRSGERFGRGWSAKARERMDQLAAASGGRLFPAASIHDLEPVFPELAEELRSVYSVAYYPLDQDFDGSWREITVEVDRPDAVVRARLGYFAR